MIQQTSLEAYLQVVGELGRRQALVFHTFQRLVSATNREVAEYLHLSINQITPRTLELRQMGLILPDTTRKCHITGRNAIAWRCS